MDSQFIVRKSNQKLYGFIAQIDPTLSISNNLLDTIYFTRKSGKV
ncbi:hypothetical protein [Okeania sp. SIO3I5]|nr:hypothetical protein [Okeania sp. SIO3I5]